MSYGYEPNEPMYVECEECGCELYSDDSVYEYEGRLLCRECFAEEMDCEYEETESVAAAHLATITTANKYLEDLEYSAREDNGRAWAEIRRDCYD